MSSTIPSGQLTQQVEMTYQVPQEINDQDPSTMEQGQNVNKEPTLSMRGGGALGAWYFFYYNFAPRT